MEVGPSASTTTTGGARGRGFGSKGDPVAGGLKDRDPRAWSEVSWKSVSLARKEKERRACHARGDNRDTPFNIDSSEEAPTKGAEEGKSADGAGVAEAKAGRRRPLQETESSSMRQHARKREDELLAGGAQNFYKIVRVCGSCFRVSRFRRFFLAEVCSRAISLPSWARFYRFYQHSVLAEPTEESFPATAGVPSSNSMLWATILRDVLRVPAALSAKSKNCSKENSLRTSSSTKGACRHSPPSQSTCMPTDAPTHPPTTGGKVYALLDKARVTIARQEALAAEEADLCERSDFLDLSRRAKSAKTVLAAFAYRRRRCKGKVIKVVSAGQKTRWSKQGPDPSERETDVERRRKFPRAPVAPRP